MSSDAAPPAAEPAPKKSKKLLVVILVVVLGVGVGGGAGAFLAGPLLAGSAKPAAAKDSAAAAKGDSGEEGEEATGDAKGGAVVHLVENIVLNPANTGGSRFLLLTVGLAVKDEAGAKVLQERDPELRDAIIRYFGAQTVEELVDISRRDSLKVGLRSAVTKRFGAQSVREVYFPQFVVQ